MEDGDVESGSDAELAAVLEHASGLIGRKADKTAVRKKRRRQQLEDLNERWGSSTYDVRDDFAVSVFAVPMLHVVTHTQCLHA